MEPSLGGGLGGEGEAWGGLLRAAEDGGGKRLRPPGEGEEALTGRRPPDPR